MGYSSLLIVLAIAALFILPLPVLAAGNPVSDFFSGIFSFLGSLFKFGPTGLVVSCGSANSGSSEFGTVNFKVIFGSKADADTYTNCQPAACPSDTKDIGVFREIRRNSGGSPAN